MTVSLILPMSARSQVNDVYFDDDNIAMALDFNLLRMFLEKQFIQSGVYLRNMTLGVDEEGNPLVDEQGRPMFGMYLWILIPDDEGNIAFDAEGRPLPGFYLPSAQSCAVINDADWTGSTDQLCYLRVQGNGELVLHLLGEDKEVSVTGLLEQALCPEKELLDGNEWFPDGCISLSNARLFLFKPEEIDSWSQQGPAFTVLDPAVTSPGTDRTFMGVAVLSGWLDSNPNSIGEEEPQFLTAFKESRWGESCFSRYGESICYPPAMLGELFGDALSKRLAPGLPASVPGSTQLRHNGLRLAMSRHLAAFFIRRLINVEKHGCGDEEHLKHGVIIDPFDYEVFGRVVEYIRPGDVWGSDGQGNPYYRVEDGSWHSVFLAKDWWWRFRIEALGGEYSGDVLNDMTLQPVFAPEYDRVHTVDSERKKLKLDVEIESNRCIQCEGLGSYYPCPGRSCDDCSGLEPDVIEIMEGKGFGYTIGSFGSRVGPYGELAITDISMSNVKRGYLERSVFDGFLDSMRTELGTLGDWDGDGIYQASCVLGECARPARPGEAECPRCGKLLTEAAILECPAVSPWAGQHCEPEICEFSNVRCPMRITDYLQPCALDSDCEADEICRPLWRDDREYPSVIRYFCVTSCEDQFDCEPLGLARCDIPWWSPEPYLEHWCLPDDPQAGEVPLGDPPILRVGKTRSKWTCWSHEEGQAAPICYGQADGTSPDPGIAAKLCGLIECAADNCSFLQDGNISDSDRDGLGNPCDDDDDDDEIPDDDDLGPAGEDWSRDHDNDGIPDEEDPDDDNDGTLDIDDYCGDPESDCSRDYDNDGLNDGEDTDDDDDGIPDGGDTCQFCHDDGTDTDGDGHGDACDWDDDNDGVSDYGDSDVTGAPGHTCQDMGASGLPPCTGGRTRGCADNCRLTPNPDQVDCDEDSIGDACDQSPPSINVKKIWQHCLHVLPESQRDVYVACSGDSMLQYRACGFASDELVHAGACGCEYHDHTVSCDYTDACVLDGRNTGSPGNRAWIPVLWRGDSDVSRDSFPPGDPDYLHGIDPVVYWDFDQDDEVQTAAGTVEWFPGTGIMRDAVALRMCMAAGPGEPFHTYCEHQEHEVEWYDEDRDSRGAIFPWYDPETLAQAILRLVGRQPDWGPLVDLRFDPDTHQVTEAHTFDPGDYQDPAFMLPVIHAAVTRVTLPDGRTMDFQFDGESWDGEITRLRLVREQGGIWTWWETQGETPDPRSGASFVPDLDRQRLLMYGGRTAHGLSNELWAFDLASWHWSRIDLPEDALALAYYTTVLDGDRFLIVGGLSPWGPLPAVLQCDLETLACEPVVIGPWEYGRLGPAVALDPNSGDIVIFGGDLGFWATLEYRYEGDAESLSAEEFGTDGEGRYWSDGESLYLEDEASSGNGFALLAGGPLMHEATGVHMEIRGRVLEYDVVESAEPIALFAFAADREVRFRMNEIGGVRVIGPELDPEVAGPPASWPTISLDWTRWHRFEIDLDRSLDQAKLSVDGAELLTLPYSHFPEFGGLPEEDLPRHFGLVGLGTGMGANWALSEWDYLRWSWQPVSDLTNEAIALEPETGLVSVLVPACTQEDCTVATSFTRASYLSNPGGFLLLGGLAGPGDRAPLMRVLLPDRGIIVEPEQDPPVISVTGVDDGGYYDSDVMVSFDAWDEGLDRVEGWLDGSDFPSGGVVTDEGGHVLVVLAEDVWGNASQVEVHFTIDRTPPAIDILGVQPGGSYQPGVSVDVEVMDENPGQVWIALDGDPYSPGTPVTAYGGHGIEVLAIDLAGNESWASVEFEVTTRPELPAHAICSIGDVSLENGFEVRWSEGISVPPGAASVATHGSVIMKNTSQVVGDVIAGSDISLRNKARIEGDVALAGDVMLGNKAEVIGSVVELTSQPSPCEVGYDLDAALFHRSVHNDNDLLLGDPQIAPFVQDGRLALDHGEQIALPSGAYYFDEVSLRNSARLVIEPGAEVELYVAGSFSIRNSTEIVNAPGNGSLLVIGGEGAEVRNSADVSLTLFAPRAALSLENTIAVYGSIVAADFRGRNSGSLVANAAAGGE